MSITDADRFAWLAGQTFNSFSLERNGDHACNYVSAAEWIDNNPDDFGDLPASMIEEMKQTNTIWTLQIYPDTPIGFHRWHGPTAASVIDAAMEHFAQ